MTTTMVGADVGALRALGNQFGAGASSLQEIAARLNGQIAQTQAWKGPDAEQFKADWEGRLRPSLVKVSERLADVKNELLLDADEQEDASAGDGGSSKSKIPQPKVKTPTPNGPIGVGKKGKAGSSLWDKIKLAAGLVSVVKSAITAPLKAFKLLKAGAWDLKSIRAVIDKGLMQRFTGWLDPKLLKNAKHVGKLAKLGKFAGRILPGLSIVTGAISIFNPTHKDGWMSWADRASGVLAVAGGIMMFTPAAPIGAACLAISAGWEIFSFIEDEQDAIKDLGNDIKSVVETSYKGWEYFLRPETDRMGLLTSTWNGIFG